MKYNMISKGKYEICFSQEDIERYNVPDIKSSQFKPFMDKNGKKFIQEVIKDSGLLEKFEEEAEKENTNFLSTSCSLGTKNGEMVLLIEEVNATDIPIDAMIGSLAEAILKGFPESFEEKEIEEDSYFLNSDKYNGVLEEELPNYIYVSSFTEINDLIFFEKIQNLVDTPVYKEKELYIVPIEGKGKSMDQMTAIEMHIADTNGKYKKVKVSDFSIKGYLYMFPIENLINI